MNAANFFGQSTATDLVQRFLRQGRDFQQKVAVPILARAATEQPFLPYVTLLYFIRPEDSRFSQYVFRFGIKLFRFGAMRNCGSVTVSHQQKSPSLMNEGLARCLLCK